MTSWAGMKKTLNIDTETVRRGLEALVRQGAYQRLRALRGSEPRASGVSRRRETLGQGIGGLSSDSRQSPALAVHRNGQP